MMAGFMGSTFRILMGYCAETGPSSSEALHSLYDRRADCGRAVAVTYPNSEAWDGARSKAHARR
jgi:hypothetical protein